MANPSVTYTFSNGTTADATQVNQNFTDLINSLTDGTKSLTLDAITAAGAAVFNGSVTLGNGSPDDITVGGSLASSIAIKTTNSYDIGASALAMRSIYFASSDSAGRATRILGATVASNWTLTLPTTGGTDGYVLQTNGSGTTSWAGITNPPYYAQNYSISCSVGSSALTITLNGGDGNALSSTNVGRFTFRNSTIGTGTPVERTITSSPTITVPSTATLGHTDGASRYIYVYLVDSGSGLVLGVSSSPDFDEGKLLTTSAIDTSSDSATGFYTTSIQTSKPIRLLARLLSTQTTAGTWASVPSEIWLCAGIFERKARSEVFISGGNGHGSTNTRIRRFVTAQINVGTAITYADSAANGGSFTINEDGIYAMTYVDGKAGSSPQMGISKNSTQLTTNVLGISMSTLLVGVDTPTNIHGLACVTANLLQGDIVRAHTAGDNDFTSNNDVNFRIVKISG